MATPRVTPASASKPLTKAQRKQLDRLFVHLVKYFGTPEGIQLSEQIHEFLVRQKARDVDLTPTEERALTFIRSELERGHSLSVREITRALGFKSSRSGMRALNQLIGR